VLVAAGPSAAQELSREAGETNLRGARLRLNGEYQDALREFNRVIELAPDSRLGWYNRGLVRRDLGDCWAALPDFTRALEIDAGFFGALYHRGNCLQTLGRFREAVADYSRAVALPGRVDGRFLAHFARGDALRRLGDPEGALADYSRVAEMRTDTAVLRSRAWVNLYLGRWQAAHDDAARFLREGEAKEHGSAYMALVGYLALRRLDARSRADAFLAQWAGRFEAGGWPAPAIRHLRGSLDAGGLLAAAASDGERLEARAYAGLGHLLAGERAQGVRLLREVLESGDPQYWEHDLAYYELRRLGEAGAQTRRPPR